MLFMRCLKPFKKLYLTSLATVTKPSQMAVYSQQFNSVSCGWNVKEAQVWSSRHWLEQLFRSAVMRASFVAQDRPDLPEAVKSLAQQMAKPTASSMADLKLLARFLLGCR